ncbi:DUF4238 domain-containing protein [Candidatus Lokiarchaeum ossiferum]|uniref:DUF4238 domain-containing protein n=1 Tax=Candidatus Lokiarchaeum ossiferum TaxID=2951803 RepID=UPI00352DAEB6
METFIKRKWGLITATSSNLFSTSDCPVVLFNQFEEEKNNQDDRLIRKKIELKYGKDNVYRSTRPNGRGRGFLSEGLEFYFPLSPNLCLYIVDYKNGMSVLKNESILRELIFNQMDTSFQIQKTLMKL